MEEIGEVYDYIINLSYLIEFSNNVFIKIVKSLINIS